MKIFFIFIFSLAMVLLTGCQPPLPQPVDEPLSSEDTPMPPEPPQGGQYEISQEAMVDSVEALVLESWALQVQAVISGNLPDGCTTIHKIESRRDHSRFMITIYTQRDKEAFCTQVLVPFEETHPLNVYGLPAGTYTIDAYGITAEFNFDQANVIEDIDDG